MRKRNKHISVWMNEQEYAYLKRQAALSGLGIDPFIRNLVRGVEIRAKTPDCYNALLRELSAIGNRINQLAAKANALNFVDAPMLKEEARRWHEFQIAVRKKYLLPRKAP